MSIVAFLGRARSGKDTCGDYLVNNYHYKKYSFADPLKRALHELFDFDSDQLYGHKKEIIDPRWNISPREAMQVVGTEIAQYTFPKVMPKLKEKVPENCFFVKCFEYWREKHPHDALVITDVRFEHEITTLLSMGATLIYIERPVNHQEKNVRNHSSEKVEQFENYAHYKIINSGTIEDVYRKTKEILE